MAETPDEILRALADPERLAIAGSLARSDGVERIALEFEPGVRYDEKTVNVMVGRFFNDFASIRRYLVDEGFLSRERGEYWRTGGRVEA